MAKPGVWLLPREGKAETGKGRDFDIKEKYKEFKKKKKPTLSHTSECTWALHSLCQTEIFKTHRGNSAKIVLLPITHPHSKHSAKGKASISI